MAERVIRFVTFEPCIITAAEYEQIRRDVEARIMAGDAGPGDRVLAALLRDHEIRYSEIRNEVGPVSTTASPFFLEERLPMSEKIQRFADRLRDEYNARRKREYANLEPEPVSVKPGPKYTRVDVGTSGKYMVVNATGEIFGIKAYGVIHRGHAYGTVHTIDQWDWSGYAAVRRAG